jgi:type II secretory pathway pseudopilin PulG
VLSLSPVISRLADAGRNVRDARGFTLIETLVAMITGIVVTGALFAILEVSLHQTARAGDVVQASQSGRNAMTHIVDELHSACMFSEFTPVQANSTPSQLVFRNTYSELAVPKSASEHKIVWLKEGGSEKAGSLTDYTYPSNGGTWPAFTYSSTASPSSGTIVAEHLSEAKNAKSEGIPIFQYYKYATAAGSVESGVPVGTLTPIALAAGKELGGTTASEVASVLVSFRAGAVSPQYKARGSIADFSSQFTFAFSAPNPETKIEDGPCQ